MINLNKKGGERLPEFQKFLVDKKLVALNKTTFYAYWVSRFHAYAKEHNAPVNIYNKSLVTAFLEGLGAEADIQGWQYVFPAAK